ncbi:Uu.00g092260.m01.CDS01 [Anthostomella pinea]|uniref:ubiquitinyl hydrolase 1 n=1 Tax=Anthostomella pinea TaxID=933095 RepID=A0AAI8YKF7_9PEZI|nr:Uu.00g092260.m01.CDS01 [Anthostomella pinea]
MRSHHLEKQLQPDRPDTSAHSNNIYDTLWERLLQPGVLVPLLLLAFTIVYQSLHSSPFSPTRHPGELVWDFIIAVTPARVLYLLDNWLHPPMFPLSKTMLPKLPTTHAAKGEILRRILGMDKPGGIISSVAQAGRSLTTLSGSTFVKQNTDSPPGLGNYDNSCFQNSILQGLSSLDTLPDYLETALVHEQARSDRDSGSAATLRELINQLTDAANNGATLWTPRKLKSLDTWQQQDAQEYFSKILDEVDKEVTRAAKTQYRPPGLETVGARDDTEDSQHSDDSGYQSLTTLSKTNSEVKIIKNPLEGLVAQRVACVQCGYCEGLSMIPFNCLTLSLGVGQGSHDLYERLDSYTDLEAIEGVECPKCTLLKIQRLLNIIVSRSRDMDSADASVQEALSRLEAVELALEEDDFEEETLADKCKIPKKNRVNSTKTKQMVIARPPQSLAVHINRSVFDERTGKMFKNLASVQFPELLDLGPWCLGSAGTWPNHEKGQVEADGVSSNTTSSDEEQWLSDPKSSMVSGELKPSKISGPFYQLRSVITHQGRHENGHYICYRRHPARTPKTDEPSEKGCNTLLNEDDSSIRDDEDTLVGDRSTENIDSDSDLKWWRMSDESVWEVSKDVVLGQGGVFMLFYDRVDSKSVLISNNEDAVSVPPDAADTAKTLGTNLAETSSGNDVSDGDDQFRGTQSGGEAMPLIGGAVTSEERDDQSTEEGHGDLGEQASVTISCLLPMLGENEIVDPVIPLRRPNR